jgi:hypothetical protein
MAKPILVINYCIDGMPVGIAVKNLRELQDVISESNANDDYYTFLLPVTTDSHIQVFYDKDFKDINYEELKKMIENKIQSFDKVPLGIELDELDERFIVEETIGEKIKQFFKKFFKPLY